MIKAKIIKIKSLGRGIVNISTSFVDENGLVIKEENYMIADTDEAAKNFKQNILRERVKDIEKCIKSHSGIISPKEEKLKGKKDVKQKVILEGSELYIEKNKLVEKKGKDDNKKPDKAK